MLQKSREGAALTASLTAIWNLWLAVMVSGCAVQADYPPWWTTPPSKVENMLALAEVTQDDVVYDLGSGDGRIVIAAAKTYGARGVGIEIDPELVRIATETARDSGVSDRVRFVRGDFWTSDFSEASVVTMYLFEETQAKLKPILLEQLHPDTRIVTYWYKIPGWTPVKTKKGIIGNIYLYALPQSTTIGGEPK